MLDADHFRLLWPVFVKVTLQFQEVVGALYEQLGSLVVGRVKLPGLTESTGGVGLGVGVGVGFGVGVGVGASVGVGVGATVGVMSVRFTT